MSDADNEQVDRLERLASLRDRGLLSADEFATEKARLLDRVSGGAAESPRSESIVTETSRVSLSASGSKPPGRKGTGLRIAAMAAVGLAAIGAFVAWLQRPDAAPQPASPLAVNASRGPAQALAAAGAASPSALIPTPAGAIPTPPPAPAAVTTGDSTQFAGVTERTSAELAWLRRACSQFTPAPDGEVRRADAYNRDRNIVAAARDVSQRNPGLLANPDHQCADRAASESAAWRFDDAQSGGNTPQ